MNIPNNNISKTELYAATGSGKCKKKGANNVSVIQMCRISMNREATLSVSVVPEKGENICSSLLQHNSLPKCSDGPF